MSRFSVTMDDRLVEEVKRLSGSKTKKQAFEIALADYVRRKRQGELAALAGSGLVDLSLEDLEAWRAGSITEAPS